MSSHELHEYYGSCEEYFSELDKKRFDTYFAKYCLALEPQGQKWVLDVGCGTGQVVKQLTHKKKLAVGVDISRIGIGLAARNGGGIFVVASATNLPFRDDVFESVGCCDFLEHTYSPHRCLKEIARVSRQNHGRIVVVAPNFLRVVGLGSPYHWHMRGIRQKTINLCALLQKAISSKFFHENMHFEFMKPKLDPKGRESDADAVCVTNPIDIKFCLRSLGVKIIYESALSTNSESPMETVSRIPIIRSVAAGTFLVGLNSPQSRKEDIYEASS